MIERIAFIGLGKMGSALAAGIQRAFPDVQLRGFDPVVQVRENFAAQYGAAVFDSPETALTGCDTVILAVKPQNLTDAALLLSAALKPGQTVLSILAGISLATLEKELKTTSVVRVMPNLPVTVGKGVCCYAPGENASARDCEAARQLLSPSGISLRVEEKMLDAVTGLSGSGPAFVFEFIIGLTAGGVASGLPPELAKTLALSTVTGAAALAEASELSLETLRDHVISPNGTTAAGMKVLAEHHFAETVSAAVEAAARRSSELGR